MVTICGTCGHEGWPIAFIYCIICEEYAIHRYCLDTLPATFEEFVDWVCDDCKPEVPTCHEFLEATCNKENTEEASTRILEQHDSELRTAEVPMCHDVRNATCNKENLEEANTEITEQRVSKFRMAELLRPKNKSMKKRRIRFSNKKRRRKNKDNDKEKNPPLYGNKECDNQEEGISPIVVKTKSTATESSTQCSQASCNENGCENRVVNESTPTLENVRIPLGDSEMDTTFSPLPDLDSSLSVFDVNSVTARPILAPVWRGSLSASDDKQDYSCRILAHISQLACSRVSQEVERFPELLSSELHLRQAVWPKGFEQHGPKDDSIALYLFPESESDEKVFKSLVSEMVLRDLALRAVVTHAELLVFPSTKLPPRLWRFQEKLYLWGVFRAKQPPEECNVHHYKAVKNRAKTPNLKTQGRAVVVS